jgi:uncharacterized protein YjbI with pentapeptide repeats
LPSIPTGEKTQKAIEEWNQAKLRLEEQRTQKRSLGLGTIGKAIKQRFTQLEKHKIEPLADRLDKADIFRIVEKLSPVIEAFGVIAIPIAIWWMTESGQEAKEKSEKAARAQEAVKTYLNQLSTVFLDGDLEKNERLRTVTRASTLALLNDPNLEGTHKGQVIDYLDDLGLIQGSRTPSDEKGSQLQKPVISLATANLRNATLGGANLNGAILNRVHLEEANLNGAYLRGADLNKAHLEKAELRGAHLEGANFNDAELKGAYLNGANLSGANFRYSDLRSTNLRGVILVGTDLSFANLQDADLRFAKLCKTKMPPTLKLNTNRNCREFNILVP